MTELTKLIERLLELRAQHPWNIGMELNLENKYAQGYHDGVDMAMNVIARHYRKSLFIEDGKLVGLRDYYYNYSDIQRAYQAGELGERYSDEYERNGSPVPSFETWYKDEYNFETGGAN